MSAPHPRAWEALSFVFYPMVRNVQSIEIYSVNPGRSHPIEDWITELRQKTPRYELRGQGVSERVNTKAPPSPPVHTNKPQYIFRILGDMLSVTEAGVVSILYPKGSDIEICHFAEPSAWEMMFVDSNFYTWKTSHNIRPLPADFNFLTPEKEQELLNLASQWIIARRASWIVEEAWMSSLELYGRELRELCERGLAMTRTMPDISEDDREDENDGNDGNDDNGNANVGTTNDDNDGDGNGGTDAGDDKLYSYD